jgi:hypothetical protein
VLAADFGAMAVTMLLKSEPIYDSLRARMLENEAGRSIRPGST